VGEEYGDRLIVVLVRGVRGFVGKYERCRGFRGERVNGVEGLWFCGNWQEVPSSWRVLVWHIFLRNYYLKKPVVRPK
jgi:hypothetical protein